jgi:hypothetical protein
MKRYMLVVVLVVISVLSIVCQKKEVDIEAEKDAITRVINSDTVWFNVSTTVDSTDSSKFYAPTNLDTALIWWRSAQTHSNPKINISIVDDSAYVEWQHNNYGYIYSLIKPPDTTWLLWTKSVGETVQVRAIFRQTGNKNDTITRGWKLNKITLATGKSDSINTVNIDSLRIQSASNPNLLIVNPLNTFFRVDSLIGFNPSEQITLTLYTNATAGEAFLHTFVLFWPFYVRLKFNALGNGVFTGTCPAQAIPFPRFAIFDLLDHSTLYTENAPYNFSGWFLPYRIK